MRYTLPTFCLFLISPVLAQQAKPAPAPLDISLRCSSVETTAQSRTVRSAAYGFGNPTHPDDDEFTKHVDRIVLIELHETSGRIHLPKSVLAAAAHPPIEGWFELGQITATPDGITASLKLNANSQSLHIDRRTGVAELVGYGSQPLRGVCRIDRKPQQF